MRTQPSLMEKYGKVIEDYVANGCLEKLPEKPSDTASYVIKRIIKDFGTNKPKACEALDKDLYMEDLIHSCKARLDAKKTVTNVCEMLDEGGMKMRNWISNQPCVLEEDIVWTKRGVLRRLAQLFDPMGLLAAFVVRVEKKSCLSSTSFPQLAIEEIKTSHEAYDQKCNEKKDIQHLIEPLSADELREAEIWLLRRDQSICFAKEITVLEKQQTGPGKTKTGKMLVPKSSPLYPLSPFMDGEGLVRLGGRLKRSPLLYDCRHPIISGKGSHLAALLIRRSHEEMKHFRVNTCLCNLRQRYWPIRGREQVKKILSSCVLCKKWRGNPGVQSMTDLSASRVDFPNPPVTLTGVDYFGPITTKAGYGGGRREKDTESCLHVYKHELFTLKLPNPYQLMIS
ncbi:Hypothetical predicted protein [Paramuricea clavata]|uniref:Integrase zinc-binding domain-containing protein n=1 Tax=Paramuricea clavata TaxID=317549 RepID=A0A6S7K5Y3_PARCT|nr:Hypothetical predicted protein [Paramuricea clavata]